MSKNSWLPTRKGTDLFPAEIQVPTVLRIKDVKPGTKLYTAVAKEYSGRLKQFHAKAQQSHALSVNPISKVRQQFGDGEARATYTNVHGNEILELELSRSTFENLKKKLETTPWDWLVVDFEAPQFEYMYSGSTENSSTRIDYYAKFIAPHVTGTPSDPSAEMGAAGNHMGQLYSGEQHPLLQWAGTPTRPQTPDGQLEEADGLERDSLLIDLRDFPAYEELVVEIYAGLEPMSDDYSIPTAGVQVAYYVIQRASTPNDLEVGGVPTPDTITGPPGVAYYDDSAVPTDYPQHGGGFLTPPLKPGDFTPVWGELYPGGMILVDIPQGANGTDGFFHENVLHYEFYPTYEVDYVTTPVAPATAITPRFALFRGTPNWVWSDHLLLPSDLDFSRWEIATNYPQRFGTANMVHTPIDAPVALNSAGPSNNYGLTKIGQIHVSPKRGWATFTPV